MNAKNLKKCYESYTDVGRITFVQGKSYIQRSSRLIPAFPGEGLMPGDSISTDKDALVQFEIENKKFSVSGNEIFQIPKECEAKEKGKITNFFNNTWKKISSFLAGDSFKTQDMTAGAGVRR